MTFQIQYGSWKVLHKKYATDRYQLGETTVIAATPEEAMSKLNAYLITQPDGIYTDLLCESVSNVSQLKVLN